MSRLFLQNCTQPWLFLSGGQCAVWSFLPSGRCTDTVLVNECIAKCSAEASSYIANKHRAKPKRRCASSLLLAWWRALSLSSPLPLPLPLPSRSYLNVSVSQHTCVIACVFILFNVSHCYFDYSSGLVVGSCTCACSHGASWQRTK